MFVLVSRFVYMLALYINMYYTYTCLNEFVSYQVECVRVCGCARTSIFVVKRILKA